MKTLIRESGKGKMSNLNHFILQFVNSKDIREYLRTIDYELKVPLNQHIPFYVDLHLYNRSDHYFWEGPIMKGAKIYSFWNDEDPRPHFHYRRKDGSEALICFDKPEYLEPSVRLSIQEKLELMRFLSAPTVMHYQYGANNYGEILEYSWLAGNRLEAFPEFTMPNYMLLPD